MTRIYFRSTNMNESVLTIASASSFMICIIAQNCLRRIQQLCNCFRIWAFANNLLEKFSVVSSTGFDDDFGWRGALTIADVSFSLAALEDVVNI